MSDPIVERITPNDPDAEAEVERILSALPPPQRRVIEQYFGFVSETSIEVEIQRSLERNLFKSIAEYEASLEGTGQTPRSLAIAELMGH